MDVGRDGQNASLGSKCVFLCGFGHVGRKGVQGRAAGGRVNPPLQGSKDDDQRVDGFLAGRLCDSHHPPLETLDLGHGQRR